jgi:hypothetical protein
MTTPNEENAANDEKPPVVEKASAASPSSVPAVLTEASAPWAERWQGWSSRLIDRSKAISSTVQAASEQAVGQARDRKSAWTLRRERARLLQSVGEHVLEAQDDVMKLLPDSAVGEIEKIRIIENELRALNAAADANQSTQQPRSN